MQTPKTSPVEVTGLSLSGRSPDRRAYLRYLVPGYALTISGNQSQQPANRFIDFCMQRSVKAKFIVIRTLIFQIPLRRKTPSLA